MGYGGGMFAPEEIRYLESLPAVCAVTANRITYAEAFKRHCLRRYREGASPVRLFREAGLDPDLIGRKRIERCFERWRKAERSLLGDGRRRYGGNGRSDVFAEPSDAFTEWADGFAQREENPDRFIVDPQRRVIVMPLDDKPQPDIRDALIAQQIRRIDELTREVDMLRAMLAAARRQREESATPASAPPTSAPPVPPPSSAPVSTSCIAPVAPQGTVLRRRASRVGNRRPVAGGRRPAMGGRRPHTGARHAAAGGCRPSMGGRRPDAGRSSSGCGMASSGHGKIRR